MGAVPLWAWQACCILSAAHDALNASVQKAHDKVSQACKPGTTAAAMHAHVHALVCARNLQASILGDISLKLSEQMKLTILQTQQDGPSPKEMAQQALKEGADLIMVSGGDGTVGAVAGALVDTGMHGITLT